MLCPNCTSYAWRKVAGSCQNCQVTVANDYHKLCPNCSTTLDECEICRTNMGTKSSSCSSGSTSQTSYTIKKNMKDNGGSVTLKVGDELEVTVDENRSREYYTGWAHDSSIISESNRGQQVAGQSHGSHQHPNWRTITFKAKSLGKTTLEIDEWQMRYDYSGGYGWYGGSGSWVKDKKTGTTWKMTITVK